MRIPIIIPTIPITLDPKTMKNEGFKPPRYGLTVITPKNEGFGFPSYKDSYKKVG